MAIGLVVHVGVNNPGGQLVQEIPGSAQSHEISRYEHRDAMLLVFGHCLLDAVQCSARFATAIDSGNLDRVADWPGSYAAIVLQPDGVTAYPDLASQFPLYYSQLNGNVLISSNPGFLARRHGRGLDPVTAAAHVACPAVLPVWSERSPYSGVHRVPGGTVLRVDSSGVRADPANFPLPVVGRTFGDAAEMLRAALTSAIRDRCKEQAVTTDFSGGIDSTVIAFLAIRHSPQPVMAVTYHQPLAPSGDLPHAMRFAGLDPRIKLAIVQGSAATLPFAELVSAVKEGRQLAEVVPWSSEPTQGVLAVSRSTLRLTASRSPKARLHLTGEGGDALLLAAPSYLSTLARLRTARKLLRHCGAYARLRYASPAVLAARSFTLARTSPRRALHGLATELTHGVHRSANWAEVISWWPPCGEAVTWLTPRARRQLADIASDPSTVRAVPEGASPADLAALTDLRRSGEAQHHLRELAGPLGIAVHAPFLDAPVIDAALRVQAAHRADPRSYKSLLRAAMAGLMPDEVLGRYTKGDYSGETYRGARSAASTLRDLLRDSRLAALRVIEPQAVIEAIDRMSAGIAVPLGPLQMVLATEIWLRMEDYAKAGALITC